MKNKYREFCKSEEEIPIFSKSWWLDAVCGKANWDVVIIEKNSKIIASLPYLLFKKRGFRIMGMPPLTQNLGPYIKYPENQKYSKRLSYEKSIMSDLILKLPDFDMFSQQFHYKITNWLPFYWNNFEQTTRYTYVIENLKDLESVYDNFDRAKKKNIKKAEKLVHVRFDLSAKEFYDNHKFTLAKQGKKISYSFSVFSSIYNSCYTNNGGRTIYAVDDKGQIHAALFVVWDKISAYDLISTIDPEFRNSGASTLLVKEMIKYCSAFTNKFDFEGSMIEFVEKSFRQFGAVQKPYFTVSKTNSKLVRTYKLLREIL